MLLPVLSVSESLAGTRRVQLRGLAGTPGHARTFSSLSDTTRRAVSDRIAERETCKQASLVGFIGEDRDHLPGGRCSLKPKASRARPQAHRRVIATTR